jgi:hypothetical protein
MNKSQQGKRNRIAGREFERAVRTRMETDGWTVCRWTNNVKEGKISASNSRFHINAGFPDFIAMAFKMTAGDRQQQTVTRLYQTIGVECKSNGTLTKEERQRLDWYIEHRTFSAIFIAKKGLNGTPEFNLYVPKASREATE